MHPNVAIRLVAGRRRRRAVIDYVKNLDCRVWTSLQLGVFSPLGFEHAAFSAGSVTRTSVVSQKCVCKSDDAGQDFVGRFGSDEGSGMAVGRLRVPAWSDELHDESVFSISAANQRSTRLSQEALVVQPIREHKKPWEFRKN